MFMWAKFVGGQCTYERTGVVEIIVPTLILFPSSNYTRMLAHSEINSTRGKNSRKYSIFSHYIYRKMMRYFFSLSTEKYTPLQNSTASNQPQVIWTVPLTYFK